MLTLNKTSLIDDIISSVYCKHSCNAFILLISEHSNHQLRTLLLYVCVCVCVCVCGCVCGCVCVCVCLCCAVNLLIWHCVCVKAKPLKQHLSLAHPVAVKCTNNSNSKINKWAIDFPECSGLLISRPAVRADTFFIKKIGLQLPLSCSLSLFLTHTQVVHKHTMQTVTEYMIHCFVYVFFNISSLFSPSSHYAEHFRIRNI